MTSRRVHGVHWADLDGLRALAILLVLARHSLRPFISEDAYEAVATMGPVDLTPALLNGWVGVDLFFVLSGFLIGRQVWRGSDGVARFWFKRATRILPAYWTCLAVVALGLTAGGAWPGRGVDFLAHVVMLQDYTGSVFYAAFWSLGTEEKFYLLAPLLVVALTSGALRRWQAAGLLVLWALPIAGRVVLSRGVTTPLGYEDYFLTFRSPFHLAAESLVVGFAIAWASARPRSAPIGRWSREGLFWSGAMVLAVVHGPGSYSRALSWPGWRLVAVHSYTLLALAIELPAVSRQTPTGEWLSFVPRYLALACGVSYLLSRFVEQPALAWRDRRLAARTRRHED